MKLICAVFSCLVTVGCENTVPEFSCERAFLHLEKQCSFGPRNPGSTGYKKCLEYLIQELQSTADTVWTQPLTYNDPHRGGSYNLQNIIARFNTNAEIKIIQALVVIKLQILQQGNFFFIGGIAPGQIKN